MVAAKRPRKPECMEMREGGERESMAALREIRLIARMGRGLVVDVTAWMDPTEANGTRDTNNCSRESK